MVPLIEEHRPELDALCRRLGVKRLDLFGSAVRGVDFDPERSDLDFIVMLEPSVSAGAFDGYFALKDGLEALFGRPVDLVIEGTIENPYRRARIEAERRPVYAR
jgi:hypothetical protein